MTGNPLSGEKLPVATNIGKRQMPRNPINFPYNPGHMTL